MIIRRTEKTKNEPDGDFSIDWERLIFISQKKAGLLVGAALLGLSLGLLYCLYQFSKPAETRLEIEMLFIRPEGVTGVTGVRKIDSVLSTFDPQIKIQDIIERWPDWSLLDATLQRSDLKRVKFDSASLITNHPSYLEATPRRFQVEGESEGYIMLFVDLQESRNKTPQIIIQGPLSRKKLKNIAENLFLELNRFLNQKALELAQTQQSYAELVRAELSQEAPEVTENMPQLLQSLQVSSNLSLLPNSQRIRLINRFLEILQNWPDESLFTYPGKKAWSDKAPSRSLWALPFVLMAFCFVGALAFYNSFGPLAEKVLGEKDLASAHPDACIYSRKLQPSQLVNLLAASFAHVDGNKGGKAAVFSLPDDPKLLEQILLAAEKSGRSFSANAPKSAMICLFSTSHPSDEICHLASQGFVRIILSARMAKSCKINHQLLQAEADLCGIPVTDVILSSN